MKSIKHCLLTAVLAAVAGGSVSAWDAAEARRAVEAQGNAVITVQIVLETTSTYQGSSEKRQTKLSATGTVIDPSGLTVASLSQTNPTEMFSRFMGDDSDFETSSRAVDVKIKAPDGTEIPADIVLRDPDLDLAFLRPKKAPEKPMAYVDLALSSKPDVLDEVFVLTRLGAVASRSLSVSVDRIRAVITKPRTFYLLNPNMHSSIGGPAITVDGKAVGITTLRFSASRDAGGRARGGMEDVVALVVLPSSTVAEIAEKAKKAAPVKEAAPAASPAEKPAAKPAPKPAPKKPAGK